MFSLASTTAARAASRSLAPAASRGLPSASSVIMIARRNYHENIVEHYENPRNVGSLDKNDDNVGTVRTLPVLPC